MQNHENWSEQLTTIGLQEFSSTYRKILSELSANGLPVDYAVITEAAAEAIIRSVAVMIEENNQALLTEIAQ